MVPFVKYHGIGNDFILINNLHQEDLLLKTSAEIRNCCDRRTGVGGDGVIFVLNPQSNSCSYTMRIFNSDGSEAEMCGNGIRCMTKFIRDHIEDSSIDINNRKGSYRIWTGAGLIITEMINDNEIKVNMGNPILQPSLIPTNLKITSKEKNINCAINSPIEVLDHVYYATAVSMGNPHVVIFTENLENMTNSKRDG